MPTYATAIANVIWKCFCWVFSSFFSNVLLRQTEKFWNCLSILLLMYWAPEFQRLLLHCTKIFHCSKMISFKKIKYQKTCWILHQNSTHWWQKMRSYRAAVAQNISKKLQHAYQKTNDRLIELARQQHRLEQYSRREWLDITGIPRNINKKDFKKLLFFWWDWSQAQWKWNHLPQTG